MHMGGVVTSEQRERIAVITIAAKSDQRERLPSQFQASNASAYPLPLQENASDQRERLPSPQQASNASEDPTSAR